MCGGSQKTSQKSTYTPTAQASGLYSNIIGQATNAAQTPYNPATGKTIADFTGLQQQAFTGVQNAQGTGQGALDAAGNLITQGAAPISGQQIQNYMDPYQKQVIDAAIAQMNQQNATAQSGLAGNAAAQQALGGNRIGVAQANLAGEQGRNANSMVSSLLSQGYGQALSAAQQDAQRQQTAAGQQMNLAQLQQGMTYNDLQALLAAGNQQQAQGQAQNDAASANATAQTMWPYQNAQWLAGIGSAVGPLTGGTTTGSSTTSQGKGVGQIVGAGLSAASLLSDRHAKEDVRHIGYTKDGQKIHTFRYKGSPKIQMGLLADEVAQSHPDAVGQHPSGFQMVDYGKATENSRFASGGGVGFGDLGGMWNELRPSQPMIPQLQAPAAAPQEQAQSPQESIALGKSARAGIDNVLRQLSPTKGWAAGTSIEPVAGAAAGKGAGGLSSLFGFAPGGGVRLDTLRHPAPDAPRETPQAPERPYLDQFQDFPMALGDQDFLTPPPADRPIQPGRAMPEGYAPGGTVDFGALGRPPEPLRDEYVGQVGESGIGEGWGMRGMAPTYGGKSLADWLGLKVPQQPDISAEAMPTPEALPQRNATMDALASGEGMPVIPQNIGEVGASGIPQPLPAAPAGLSIGDADVDLIENAPWAAAPKEQARLEVGPAETVTRAAVPGLSTADFIKQQEGYNPRAYADGRQTSIGYGTRARFPGEVISREEAEQRLAQETGIVDNWLDANIKVPLTPGQRTALTSFGYNLGVDDLDKLKADINAGNWDRVAMRMPSFNQFQGKPLEALTERRLREVALLRGEGAPAVADGDPGAAGAAPQIAAGLVQRATDPRAAPTGGYAGKKDKAVGGILKSIFGVEFNPLNLEENERLALLAAGLSMMSNGDIGGGGLAGLGFLQKANAADRDAIRDAQALALEMEKTRRLSEGKWSPSAGGEIVVNDATGETRRTGHEKAQTDTPAIKEYGLAVDQGYKGTFTEFEQERKAMNVKGDLGGELGARIGLGDLFLSELPSIRESVKKFGWGDKLNIALGRGAADTIRSKVDNGVDGLRRNLTGAGMSITEADDYVRRYQISSTDGIPKMLDKLENLEKAIIATREGAIKGKTGQLAREFRAGEAPKVTTGDPLAEARAAIAKGAPRDAVVKRLEERGISATGL